MIKQKVLDYILNGEGFISSLMRKLLYIYKKNQFMLEKNNSLELNKCYIAQTKIDVCGTNNRIIIKNGTVLKNCLIRVSGNNNIVSIGAGCNLVNFSIMVIDHNGEIKMGDNGSAWDSRVVTMEGKKVLIGNNFMISDHCDIRSGDGHSILNQAGERTNLSMDIVIGDNVWISHGCTFLKGVSIEHDSIVAAHSVVTKKFVKPHVIISGSPAKEMRTDVSWIRDRI